MPHPPLKTFIIYARADAEYKIALRHHLMPLERQGLLDVWDDAHLLPGEDWGKSIENRLDESDLVLMLVSAASLFSDFIQNTELKKTLERKRQGATQFIPILVRDCLWEDEIDISSVQILPVDEQRKITPVAAWASTDSAWASALRELKRLLPAIQKKIADDREALAAAQQAAQEEEQAKAAAEKAEKLRYKRDEAAWKKMTEALAAAATQDDKIEIYNTYLEDEDNHLNHREEAEEAIHTLEGELRLARRLAEKEAQKLLDAQRKAAEKAAAEKAAAEKAAAEKAVTDAGLVFVRGGSFEMGDVIGDKEYDNETVHSVTLSDYYIGVCPVTFEEYDVFCESTGKEKPSDSGWGRGKRPVINVSWYDAVEYCNWRSRQAKLKPVYTINGINVSADWSANGYRLPTEAEWEYAARALNGKGGGKVRFGNGKDIADPKEINFYGKENAKKTYSVVGEYRGNTSPVGNFSPNSLGLYDMSGNVWDWCWDWYGDYPTASQTDPKGPNSGSCRVLRGGSWDVSPVRARCAYRRDYTPGFRFSYLGFRLARAAP